MRIIANFKGVLFIYKIKDEQIVILIKVGIFLTVVTRLMIYLNKIKVFVPNSTLTQFVLFHPILKGVYHIDRSRNVSGAAAPSSTEALRTIVKGILVVFILISFTAA